MGERVRKRKGGRVCKREGVRRRGTDFKQKNRKVILTNNKILNCRSIIKNNFQNNVN